MFLALRCCPGVTLCCQFKSNSNRRIQMQPDSRVLRTPQNKLQTVINVLFNDATVDPAWTQVNNMVNFIKYSKKYATSSLQVRAKTAFYLACVMEEDADLAERESNRVQRNLTELCIGPDLLNLAFHQDEASEYVAR